MEGQAHRRARSRLRHPRGRERHGDEAAQRTGRPSTPDVDRYRPRSDVAVDHKVIRATVHRVRGVAEGHSRSTTSRPSSTRDPRCSVVQWQFPTRQDEETRPTTTSANACAARPARPARGSRRPRGLLLPAVRVGLLRGQQRRGTTLVVWKGRRPHAGMAAPSRSRASGANASSASPTFFRSGRNRVSRTTRAFHVVTMGARAQGRGARQELFKDNRYQDYLLLHGLSVEDDGSPRRALAPAHP